MNKAFLPRFLLYFVLSVFGLPFSPSVPQWSSLVREHVVVSAEMILGIIWVFELDVPQAHTLLTVF